MNQCYLGQNDLCMQDYLLNKISHIKITTQQWNTGQKHSNKFKKLPWVCGGNFVCKLKADSIILLYTLRNSHI